MSELIPEKASTNQTLYKKDVTDCLKDQGSQYQYLLATYEPNHLFDKVRYFITKIREDQAEEVIIIAPS